MLAHLKNQNLGIAGCKCERCIKRGVIPKDDLVGNAWKQSALEAWMPLVDTLLGAVAKTVPAPRAPPANSASQMQIHRKY